MAPLCKPVAPLKPGILLVEDRLRDQWTQIVKYRDHVVRDIRNALRLDPGGVQLSIAAFTVWAALSMVSATFWLSSPAFRFARSIASPAVCLT
jgi:hypothetical protein